MSDAVNFDFETNLQHGSPEWYASRHGMTMGSSDAGSVFSGVVTGSSRRELCDRFKGLPKRPIAPYVQSIMNEGHKMEPYLLQEVTALFDCMILRANLYRLPFLTHGVQEQSTPDGIVVTRRFPHRLALVEIKWRPTSPDDAGWGPARDRLDLKVWCQAQHQMYVTGIHRCFVYAGSPSGARRMWTIAYCAAFRPYFEAALEACVADRRFDSESVCQVKLGRMMALTSKVEYVRVEKDSTVEEIKGGRQSSSSDSETQEMGTDSEETIEEDC